MNPDNLAPLEAHLDPESLGAYLEGRDSKTDRRAAERHLASCEECYELFVECARALDEDNQTSTYTARDDGAASDTAKALGLRHLGGPRSWRPIWFVGAAAAVVVFAWVGSKQLGDSRSNREALVQLAAALPGYRPVQGRLTAGFTYGPLVSSSRAESGARPLSTRVESAVARAQEAVSGFSSPDALATQGVSLLILGQFDEAISTLERAAAGAPSDAAIQSDLSAAYLERARTSGRTDDVERALVAASRAVQLAPDLSEARYNQALALQQLARTLEARHAWESYLALDPDSGWAQEAKRFLASGP